MAKTQNEMIYEHMKKHGSITSMEAFELYGITRLASRIHDLRNIYGVRIVSDSITKKNRSGKLVSYSRYRIREAK